MLSEKLQLVSTGSGQAERTGSSPSISESDGGGNNVRWGEGGREDGKPLDQAYEELKEEYKVRFKMYILQIDMILYFL